MKLAILSDDLTGASGVASMIGTAGTITINSDNLGKIRKENFDYISINMNTRETSPSLTKQIIEEVLGTIGNARIALRIDSTLRGNIGVQVQALLKSGNLLLTDTIPEYGRYTENGFTVYNSERSNIRKVLNFDVNMSAEATFQIMIADSRTEEDLGTLALKCIEDGLIPVDPGPLIAHYAARLEGIVERK